MQEVWHRIRLRGIQVRPDLRERLLQDMRVAGRNSHELYANGQLARSCKIQLDAALFVIAEGKTLVV